jgi:hypothetical protein
VLNYAKAECCVDGDGDDELDICVFFISFANTGGCPALRRMMLHEEAMSAL